MSIDIPPGTILLDKYRVDRVLGKGGMGIVLAATHLQLQERVAMKFLLPEVLGNRELVTRFMREAQAAVRLKSEHVARVSDVGTLPWGAPYMVMEYLSGSDLAALLEQRGTLPAPEIVDYLMQACEALSEAHALGIIHRDIKPANFFITRRPDGSPLLKVLDFGISKAPLSVEGALTSTRAVMGTPSYMSPEQMRSVRDVDARTDIWALGVVLYECLSGQRPFEAETFSGLCLKAAMDPPPPLQISLPPGLDRIVYRCLEKEHSHRFSSVAELALALAPYASNQRQASLSLERTAAILGLAAGAAGDLAPYRNPVDVAVAHASHSHPGAMAVPTTLRGSAASLSRLMKPSSRGWIGSGLVAVAGAVLAIALTAGGEGDSGNAAPAREAGRRAAAPGEAIPAGTGGGAPSPPQPSLIPPPDRPSVLTAALESVPTSPVLAALPEAPAQEAPSVKVDAGTSEPPSATLDAAPAVLGAGTPQRAGKAQPRTTEHREHTAPRPRGPAPAPPTPPTPAPVTPPGNILDLRK